MRRGRRHRSRRRARGRPVRGRRSSRSLLGGPAGGGRDRARRGTAGRPARRSEPAGARRHGAASPAGRPSRSCGPRLLTWPGSTPNRQAIALCALALGAGPGLAAAGRAPPPRPGPQCRRRAADRAGAGDQGLPRRPGLGQGSRPSRGPGRLLERALPDRRVRRPWTALAGRHPRAPPLGAPAGRPAACCLVLVTVLLTYSRGGLLALITAVVVTVAFLPRRWHAVVALAAGAIGALPAAAHALHRPSAVGRPGAHRAARVRRPRPRVAPGRRGRRRGGPRPARREAGARAASPRARPAGGRRDPGRVRPRVVGALAASASARAGGRATARPSSAARAETPSPTTPAAWSTPPGISAGRGGARRGAGSRRAR